MFRALIAQGIQAGYSVFNRYKDLIRGKRLNRHNIMILFETEIRPATLYVAETMCLIRGENRKLIIYEKRMIEEYLDGRR